MAYTRAYLLATWSSGSTKRAFRIKMDGYRPGTGYPKQIGRNLSGDLLEARGVDKDQFTGTVLIDERDSGGTVIYDTVTYNLAQLADLKAMYAATDLQIKRFEDTSFFSAATVGELSYTVMDTVGRISMAEVRIVEK